MMMISHGRPSMVVRGVVCPSVDAVGDETYGRGVQK